MIPLKTVLCNLFPSNSFHPMDNILSPARRWARVDIPVILQVALEEECLHHLAAHIRTIYTKLEAMTFTGIP